MKTICLGITFLAFFARVVEADEGAAAAQEAVRPAIEKAKAGAPKSLIVFDVTAFGLSPEIGKVFTEVVSTECTALGIKTIGLSDVQAMLSIEETKKLINCSNEECLAEIGGALGIEKIITGSAGLLGDKALVTLKLINNEKREVENRLDATSENDGDEMVNVFRRLTRKILGFPEDFDPREDQKPLSWYRISSFTSAGLSALCLAGGLLAGQSAKGSHAEYEKARDKLAADHYQRETERKAVLANALFGVSAGAVAAAVVLWLVEPADNPDLKKSIEVSAAAYTGELAVTVRFAW